MKIEAEVINVVSISSASSSDTENSGNSDSDDELDTRGGPGSLEEAILRTGYAESCHLHKLKQCLSLVHFSPGSVVCSRDSPIEGMYILLDYGPVMLNEGSGDVIGFGELIDSHGLIYSAGLSADTVKCLQSCCCAFLPRCNYGALAWQTFRTSYLRVNVPLLQCVDTTHLDFEYKCSDAGDIIDLTGKVIVVIDGLLFNRGELHFYPGHIIGVLEYLNGQEEYFVYVQARCTYAILTSNATEKVIEQTAFTMTILESVYQRSVMKEVKSKVRRGTVLYRCESQGRITLAPVVPSATLIHDMGNLTKVNEFTVTGYLGNGSTARVYECTSDTSEKFAVKMVYKTKARESLHREIMALQDLKHSHIVKLFSIINDPTSDVAFLVAELGAKGSLVGVVMSTSLECQRVMSDIMSALTYIHANGYVHRDVKPANILMMSDGKAKLTDFGCAIHLNDCASKKIKFMGTPAFMAPELFSTGLITPAIDIWSLVGTMYYLVYGTLPFKVEGPVLSKTVTFSVPVLGWDASSKCQQMLTDNWTNDDIMRFKHLCKEGFKKDPEKRITLEKMRQHDWLMYTM